MTRREQYRRRLRQLRDWDTFLLKHSGLPGPRGNLELAQAVADEGHPRLFQQYRSSPHEFLAFCGVLGLGRLLAEGKMDLLSTLRPFASDPRWRVREAVAMALQRLGEVDMPLLLREMQTWSRGTHLEQRAAAAALCEPRLLRRPEHAKATLQILDTITASIARAADRRSEDLLTLRKGLAYCWSVAAAALPMEGKRRMEKWFANPNLDIRWIMRENLKKDRLARADSRWVQQWQAKLAR